MALPALVIAGAQAYISSKVSSKVFDAGSSAAESFQRLIDSIGSEVEGKDHLLGNTLGKANEINDLMGMPGIIDMAAEAPGRGGPLVSELFILSNSPGMEDRSNDGPSH